MKSVKIYKIVKTFLSWTFPSVVWSLDIRAVLPDRRGTGPQVANTALVRNLKFLLKITILTFYWNILCFSIHICVALFKSN